MGVATSRGGLPSVAMRVIWHGETPPPRRPTGSEGGDGGFAAGARTARDEEIVVPEEPAAGRGRPVTGLARFGFDLVWGFFLYAVGMPALVVAWLAAGALLATGAGLVLFTAGSMDPEVFRTSASTAVILDAVLLLGIGLAGRTRAAAGDEAVGGYARHPALWTSLGLLALLGASAGLLASSAESALADRAATIITLCNLGFFALLCAAGTTGLLFWLAGGVRRWALATPYRAGMMTTLLLLSAVGARVALAERWHAAPLAELRADVDLQALWEARGALDFTQRALCVAANEAIEGGVAATSAPECATLLAGGSGTSQGAPPVGSDGGEDSCFDELQPVTAQVREQLEAARVPTEIAEDAVSEALVVTCSKTPRPANLRGYFYRVARNYGLRELRTGRRHVDCQVLERLEDEAYAGRCVASSSDEEQDAEAAAALWKTVRCNVGETTEQVIKARLAGQRFRAIGAQLGISEAVARSKFHNAMTKLRTRREICNSPLRAGR